MLTHQIVIRLTLAFAVFAGALVGGFALFGQTSRATIASAASLPDEGTTGLYQPFSFARMNKVIAICEGC